MKTLKEANKEEKAFTNTDDWCEDTEYTTTNGSETFRIKESTDCLEIYSSLFGDEEAATTYRKDDYTKEEAIKDYQINGIY